MSATAAHTISRTSSGTAAAAGSTQAATTAAADAPTLGLVQVGEAGSPDAPVEVVDALTLQALQLILQEVEVPHVHAEALLRVRGVVLGLLGGHIVARPDIRLAMDNKRRTLGDLGYFKIPSKRLKRVVRYRTYQYGTL
jgi:hypothetical protein